MSYWGIMDGRQLLLATRESDDPKTQRLYNETKEIANQSMLVVGMPGSGKSVFANTCAHKLQRLGFTVVYVTEKPDAEFDNAFCLFPQENEHLLHLLKNRYSIGPYSKERCMKLAKLYHPFTFNIPDEKLPPIDFFSIPIAELGDQSIASLFKGDMEGQAFDNVQREIRKLKRQDGFFKMISNVDEAIGDGSKKKVKPNVFGIAQEVEGTQHTKKSIISSFTPYVDEYFLHPKSSLYNLDFVSLLNDNKHQHFFSTRWINNTKIERIFTIMLIEQILKALATGKVHRRICLVFEEIKVLIPKETKHDFEKDLAIVFMKLLSTIRSQAFVIATTQEYFQTHDRVVGSFTERYYGKLAPEDKERMNKNYGLGIEKMRVLNGLRVGQFVRLQDLNSKKPMIGQAPLPPFSIQEEGLSFFQKFPQAYPELMRKYTDVKQDMKVRLQAEKQLAMERFEKRKARLAEAEEHKTRMKEKKADEFKLRKEKFDKKLDLKRRVWDTIKALDAKGQKWSFAAIGRKFLITDKTAKKYYLEIEDRVRSGSVEDQVVHDEVAADSEDQIPEGVNE